MVLLFLSTLRVSSIMYFLNINLYKASASFIGLLKLDVSDSPVKLLSITRLFVCVLLVSGVSEILLVSCPGKSGI